MQAAGEEGVWVHCRAGPGAAHPPPAQGQEHVPELGGQVSSWAGGPRLPSLGDDLHTPTTGAGIQQLSHRNTITKWLKATHKSISGG